MERSIGQQLSAENSMESGGKSSCQPTGPWKWSKQVDKPISRMFYLIAYSGSSRIFTCMSISERRVITSLNSAPGVSTQTHKTILWAILHQIILYSRPQTAELSHISAKSTHTHIHPATAIYTMSNSTYKKTNKKYNQHFDEAAPYISVSP